MESSYFTPIGWIYREKPIILTKQSLQGTQNLYGDNTSVPNNNISQELYKPTVIYNRYNSNDISGLTGCSKQFGNNPTNIKPNYNKETNILRSKYSN